MRHPELIDALLADADPLKGIEPADPDGTSALAVREGAAQCQRPSGRRRAAIAAAAVVGLVGATGATVAYSRGDGRASTSDGVVCNGTATMDLQAGIDLRLEDPVEVCSAEWLDAFGLPAPPELTACVDPGAQGAIEVYPGPPTVCADHDSIPYTGPTDEQLRFAAFRHDALELRESLGAGECISLEEIKAALDPLLATHGLDGWTYAVQGVPGEPCAQVEAFVERTKTVLVTRHSQ